MTSCGFCILPWTEQLWDRCMSPFCLGLWPWLSTRLHSSGIPRLVGSLLSSYGYTFSLRLSVVELFLLSWEWLCCGHLLFLWRWACRCSWALRCSCWKFSSIVDRWKRSFNKAMLVLMFLLYGGLNHITFLCRLRFCDGGCCGGGLNCSLATLTREPSWVADRPLLLYSNNAKQNDQCIANILWLNKIKVNNLFFKVDFCCV